MLIRTINSAFLVALFIAFSFPVQAQNTAKNTVSDAVLYHAKEVSRACEHQWNAPQCLSALSQSAMTQASRYAADLQQKNRKSAAEHIKQNCAAATAAIERSYPAEAMTSAFTACANAMVETAEQTGIRPDPSHYQLLIGSILCLTGNEHCAAIESSLP